MGYRMVVTNIEKFSRLVGVQHVSLSQGLKSGRRLLLQEKFEANSSAMRGSLEENASEQQRYYKQRSTGKQGELSIPQ